MAGVESYISNLYRNPKIRGIRGKNSADEGGAVRYSDRDKPLVTEYRESTMRNGFKQQCHDRF